MALNSGFIIQQLNRLASDAGLRIDQHHAWIKCPWHGRGRERTGSLRIHLDRSTEYRIGSYFCFGCQARGEWNDLARQVKLRRYKKSSSDDFDLEISDNLRQSLLGEDTPQTSDLSIIRFAPLWPKREKWRGMPGWLVNKLDGRLINTRYGERLYLPVRVNKQIVGGITCTLDGKAKRKYIYEPGRWLRDALFPYDYVKRLLRNSRRRIIFLVEGPRDAMRLLSFGIPALAILGGTSVWRINKAELLLLLEPDLICLCFDPDSVGQQVTRLAYNDLHGQVSMKRIKFTVEQRNGQTIKHDAGEMPEWRVNQLKTRLRL